MVYIARLTPVLDRRVAADKNAGAASTLRSVATAGTTNDKQCRFWTSPLFAGEWHSYMDCVSQSAL